MLGASAALLLMTSSAVADGISRRPATIAAPTPVYEPAPTWSGFYIGAGIGAGPLFTTSQCRMAASCLHLLRGGARYPRLLDLRCGGSPPALWALPSASSNIKPRPPAGGAPPVPISCRLARLARPPTPAPLWSARPTPEPPPPLPPLPRSPPSRDLVTPPFPLSRRCRALDARRTADIDLQVRRWRLGRLGSRPLDQCPIALSCALLSYRTSSRRDWARWLSRTPNG